MNKSFLEKQKDIAYDNYNYFFVKMIISVLQICFKLALVLLISAIFNYLIINIITLIYAIISLFYIYDTINKYLYIIDDIKNTLNISELSFEIDLRFISNNLFKGMFSYGK